MAKRVQLIRHNTGGADAFTGLLGEITVDTTAKEIRLHDSLTAGGIPQARKDLANVAIATVSSAGKMSAADKVELTTVRIDLSADLATEVTNRIADVDAEETRALLAEGVLQTNIDSEASTRATNDGTLQTNIDNEASTRGSADSTLQDNIDAEALARSNADTTLQDNIDALPIPVPVFLDSPEELLSTTAPATTATALGSATLDAANATHAIISIEASIYTSTTSIAWMKVAIDKSSSISTTTNRKCNPHSPPVVNSWAYDSNQVLVELDSNHDFWYIVQMSSSWFTRGLVIHLDGYYA